MKLIFKSLVLVAAAVATLTSCEKAPEVTPAAEEFTLTVNATLPAPDGTKTYLGEKVGTEYPVLWSEEDQIRVSQVPYYTEDGVEFAAAGNTSSKYSKSIVRSADNKTATFDFPSFTTPADSVNFIDYLAIYGGSDYSVSKRNSKYQSITVTLPTTQTPAAGQFDPKAALMATAVLGTTTTKSSLDLNFEHLAAYAMLNVKNLNCGSEEVESVTITSAEHKLSGKSYWYYLEGTNFKTISGDASNKVVVDMTAQDLTNNNFEVYFTATPTEFAVNDKLTFVVTTNADNTYTKEVTVESAFEFEQGSILDFSVDFNGVAADEKVVIEGKQYELVTSTSELTPGREILFVYTDGTNYYGAGGANGDKTAANTYLLSVDLENINGNTISITDEAVDVFTVGTGITTYDKKEVTYYTFTSSKYSKPLGSPGSKGNIHYGKTGAATQWLVTITDGVAQIRNVNSDTYYLQYNTGSPRFSGYANTLKNPSIYKKVN